MSSAEEHSPPMVIQQSVTAYAVGRATVARFARAVRAEPGWPSRRKIRRWLMLARRRAPLYVESVATTLNPTTGEILSRETSTEGVKNSWLEEK